MVYLINGSYAEYIKRSYDTHTHTHTQNPTSKPI